MAPLPIGIDPMLAAKCFAPVFVPEALFVFFGAIAVAVVVFLALLPLAFRYDGSRPIRPDADQPSVRPRPALDEAGPWPVTGSPAGRAPVVR